MKTKQLLQLENIVRLSCTNGTYRVKFESVVPVDFTYSVPVYTGDVTATGKAIVSRTEKKVIKTTKKIKQELENIISKEQAQALFLALKELEYISTHFVTDKANWVVETNIYSR